MISRWVFEGTGWEGRVMLLVGGGVWCISRTWETGKVDGDENRSSNRDRTLQRC